MILYEFKHLQKFLAINICTCIESCLDFSCVHHNQGENGEKLVKYLFFFNIFPLDLFSVVNVLDNIFLCYLKLY